MCPFIELRNGKKFSLDPCVSVRLWGMVGWSERMAREGLPNMNGKILGWRRKLSTTNNTQITNGCGGGQGIALDEQRAYIGRAVREGGEGGLAPTDQDGGEEDPPPWVLSCGF